MRKPKTFGKGDLIDLLTPTITFSMDAELELDLSVPAVVEKYKAAADVANRNTSYFIRV